jgi:F-type H+-transporting ATPase subunit delta
MSEGAIAERYAQALLELGQEKSQLAALAAGMAAFARAMESSRQLRSVALDPTVLREERAAVLRAVAERLAMPEVGIKGLLLIAARGRIGVIGAISRRLGELSDEVSGVLRGAVTTAREMPETFFTSLSEGVAAATGKKVVLSRAVDPSLIGCAVARIGDSTIDASVLGRLSDIQRELTVALGGGV